MDNYEQSETEPVISIAYHILKILVSYPNLIQPVVDYHR